MREIKFRAWDKINNRMFYSGFNDWSISGVRTHDELFLTLDGKLQLASYYGDQRNELGDYLAEGNTNNYILMQYAGLKDKNGKEIYEGDIVMGDITVMSDNETMQPMYTNIQRLENFKYADGSVGVRLLGNRVYIVEWFDASCGFEPFSDSSKNCGHCGGGLNSKVVEVVGNIYENPDLIS